MSLKRYLVCVHCNPSRQCSDLEDFSTHLFRTHPTIPSYKCLPCKKEFMHKTSLMRHLREKHVNNSEDESSSSQSSAGDNNATGNDEEDFNSDHNEVEAGSNCDMFTVNPKVEASLFLMNLRSSGNLTHSSVKMIQEHVEKLVASVLSNAGAKTAEFLKEDGVLEEGSASFIKETFGNYKVFDGLYTIEDQLNYFAEQFGMVLPQEKYLSSRIENRYDREKRMFLPTQVLETFQYVSLIDTLKVIIRNNFLRKLIEEEQGSSDGVYRSYRDGADFKTNTFLQKYPNAIRIVLYQDDLEVANALGSKDTIHKLGCFYFSIQNFPPEESSLLASIFLLALCYAEDLKKKGVFSKVLTSLQEELKLLMSDAGIEVDLPNGEKYILRACLVCFCGDSLAAHAILGFLSPSANKFCRMCMISKQEFANDSTFTGELRTVLSHKHHVNLVEEDCSCSPLYGVKERSILIDMIKVPQDGPFDIFHDLVGIIEMDLKLALREFICVRKLFKVWDFNSNLNMFDYGKPDVKNKPSPNFLYSKLMGKGHSLKQSGSQTFCLLRIFPFVVTGVEASDPYMELIYILQDIVKILFSFEIKEADVAKLETLICDHNRLFHKLFISLDVAADEENRVHGPENDEEDEDEDEVDEEIDGGEVEEHGRRRPQSKRLKKAINKMHHWLHYPQIIREKGPLIRLWCARFEARHRIFRKHAGVQSNFKNVPKTMARVFQLSTLSGIVQRTGPRGITMPSSKETSTVNQCKYRDLLLLRGLEGNDIIQIVQSVEVCGEDYVCGLFVSLKHAGRQPVFGLISDIIVKVCEIPSVYFVVSKCQNNGLNARYNAYHINNTFEEADELVDVQDLSNHRPIAAWSPVDPVSEVKLYLSPRTMDF